MTANRVIQIGIAVCFLSVAFGAFGAHAMKASLSAYSLGVYQTAVDYQFFHGLALLALGIWGAEPQQVKWPAIFFTVGVLLFSGSLYILAISGVKAWGMVTPLGGTCFLIGWVVWGLKVSKMDKA